MTKSKTGAISQEDTAINKSGIPTPDGIDIVSKGTEYFRISRAAEILGCMSEDLLQMGATGNAEIIAPVISAGIYEWPVGWDGTSFPEIEPSFHTGFSAADRVILSMADLAKIEAIGWTIPTFFYAPTKAREVTENWYGSSFFEPGELGPKEAKNQSPVVDESVNEQNETTQPERVFTDDDVLASKLYRPNSGAPRTWRKPNTWHQESFLTKMSENAISVPWYAVDPVARYIDEATINELDEETVNNKIIEMKETILHAEKTTIAHLFISKQELQRLNNGLAQDGAALKRNKQMNERNVEKVNGHSERHASKREPMWKLAVYCLGNILGNVKPKELTDAMETELVNISLPGMHEKMLAMPTIYEYVSDALAGKR